MSSMLCIIVSRSVDAYVIVFICWSYGFTNIVILIGFFNYYLVEVMHSTQNNGWKLVCHHWLPHWICTVNLSYLGHILGDRPLF